MGNNNDSLLKFLAGLALMSVGLFLFLNKVHVGSAGIFGWGMIRIGSFGFPSGLVVVPFIIGIIWAFGSGASTPSLIFTGISILLIIAAVIMTSSFWLDRMTMFDWLLILVMTFGGGAIVVRMLLQDRGMQKSKDKAEAEMYKKMAELESMKSKSLEKELNDLKKGMQDNQNA